MSQSTHGSEGARRQPIWHSASEAEIPPDLSWLAPAEEERAATLSFTKRRNDYLLGRFTSKSAVASALHLSSEPGSLRRIEVRNRMSGPERGAPEVFIDGSPAPLALSITDRAGWGVCMLTPAGSRVGCDLELVEMRSDAFVADYLTAPERDFVATGAGEEACWARANLVWSAKESVLKVLRTGLRRDTRSVEVHIPAGPCRGGWRPLCARTSEGRQFSGWWHRFGSFLLTAAFEEATVPPRALVEPPGLRNAVPTHAWLDAPRTP